MKIFLFGRVDHAFKGRQSMYQSLSEKEVAELAAALAT